MTKFTFKEEIFKVNGNIHKEVRMFSRQKKFTLLIKSLNDKPYGKVIYHICKLHGSCSIFEHYNINGRISRLNIKGNVCFSCKRKIKVPDEMLMVYKCLLI